MQGQGKRTLLVFVLLSSSIFCVVLVVSMYSHFKKVERDFNVKRATLIKENLELEDSLKVVKEDLAKKEESILLLREEVKKIESAYKSELVTLRRDNTFLATKIKEFRGKSLIDQLREAIEKETESQVRKYFEKMLYNAVLLKSGKSINLDPIVVAKKEERPKRQNFTSSPEETKKEISPPQTKPIPILTGTRGKVLSVDNRYNLVVVNLGRRNKIKEGQRLSVLRNEKEIAQAEIINVRYKIAAAFVDDIQYRYNIHNIHEGDEVVVRE